MEIVAVPQESLQTLLSGSFVCPQCLTAVSGGTRQVGTVTVP